MQSPGRIVGTIAKLLLSMLAFAVLFSLGVLTTYLVISSVYGEGHFEGNAPAQFGVLMEGHLGGIVFVVLSALVAYFVFRTRNHQPPEIQN